MIEAHPTDYNGIRFRSKCEAIFYRNLELGGWLVEYEPKKWLVEGWSFDFLAARKSRSGTILNLLIEYKPAEPTAAYMERHKARIHSLGLRLCGFETAVAFGSPFNDIRKTLVWKMHICDRPDVSKGSGEIWWDWQDCERSVGLFNHINEASEYRFDLDSSSARRCSKCRLPVGPNCESEDGFQYCDACEARRMER